MHYDAEKIRYISTIKFEDGELPISEQYKEIPIDQYLIDSFISADLSNLSDNCGCC